MSGLNVYFGGTFDPPHIGHHEILLSILNDAWTDKIYLVPTSQNPLKKSESHSFFSDKKIRREWMELWLAELQKTLPFHLHTKIEVLWTEFESDGPSYTIDTFQKLSTASAKPWALAFGADNLSSLAKWKSIEELLQSLHSLWVFPRGHRLDPFEGLPPELRALCDFRIMNDEITDISSTEIRERVSSLRVGEALPKLPLLPSVAASLKRLVSHSSNNPA